MKDRVMVGDAVKIVKWRDGGMTAEVLYIGRIIEIMDDALRVVVIDAFAVRGYCLGDRELESFDDVIPISDE